MREEHDPIEQVRARLLRDHKVSEDDLKAIDGEIRAIIAEAVDFATHDPEPDPAELWTDVLMTGVDFSPGTVARNFAMSRNSDGDQVLMPALSPTMRRASSPNG